MSEQREALRRKTIGLVIIGLGIFVYLVVRYGDVAWWSVR